MLLVVFTFMFLEVDGCNPGNGAGLAERGGLDGSM